MPVTCPYCQTHFPKSEAINSRHKAVCLGWQETLGDLKPLPCLCGHEEASRTQMKRHHKTCFVWKSRHRGTVQMERLRATFRSKYGQDIMCSRDVPGAVEKQRATNLKRYGAESTFSKESNLFSKVQEASRAADRSFLRGEDNPFAWPEVKEKIRQAHLEKYGVENPNQSQEVRAKTKTTNLERYGAEEVLSSPEIRSRIRATCEAKYGGPSPSSSEDVVEKTRQTNLRVWGVDWTCQHPDVRRRQYEAMVEHYGSHYWASEEGRACIRASCLKAYGVSHPMMNPEIAVRAITNARTDKTPNKLEGILVSAYPELIYTGNGSFWRRLPLIGHSKNPDFIVPGPDPSQPKRGVTKVVEVFGDFWHSKRFTGQEPEEHLQTLVDAYANIGIACLVLWESDIRTQPDAVKAKLETFLAPA